MAKPKQGAQGKGSQLSNLKASLKSAGVIKKPNSKSARERSAGRADNDAERRRAALEDIRSQFNPFGVKFGKQKHNVLGRKVRGVQGAPESKRGATESGQRAAYGESQRRQTRAGGIVDRRFGEYNAKLSTEEKMLRRFTHERQKGRIGKRDIFNLGDDDDDDENGASGLGTEPDATLTHYGQSLAELDDFDEPDIADEGEDAYEEELVRRGHFGGFDDEEVEDSEQGGRRKSKAEVMQEIIAKSKAYKQERQREKEADLENIDELDDEMEALQSALRADPRNAADSVKAARMLKSVDNDDMTYDSLVREMAFERRARPADRTKTEEELAKEMAEELEEKERKRLKRMRGEPDSDDEENDESSGRKGSGFREADGLGDDFVSDGDDNEFGELGDGLQPLQANVDSELDVDSGSEDEEQGSSSDVTSEAEKAESAEDAPRFLGKGLADRKQIKNGQGKVELPFKFPCPQSLEEFDDILESVAVVDYPIVVHRIRTLHHPNLHPENRPKLRKFGPVLFKMTLIVADEYPSELGVIEELAKHLYSMAKAFPNELAEAFHEHVDFIRDNPDFLTERLSQRDLVYFALVKKLFPTSDLLHYVATPAMLLMGNYLSYGPMKNAGDILVKVYVSNLFLAYQEISQRFIPEVVNVIAQSLMSLAPSAPPKAFPWLPNQMQYCRIVDVGTLPAKNDASEAFASRDEMNQDRFKIKALVDTAKLCQKCCELYSSKRGYLQVMGPLLELLDLHIQQPLEASVKSVVEQAHRSLRRTLEFSLSALKPLQVQHHRPIPLETHAPRFETSYSLDRISYDPNRERAEASKKAALERDAKRHEMRSLRRTSQFVARQRAQEQRQRDDAYNKKMTKLEHQLKHFESAV